jgi:regulator of protease activity HflC (stomatin/prohibitin superfamily)
MKFTKTITTNRYGKDETEVVPNWKTIIPTMLIGIVALIFFFGSWGIVGAGERGVKVRLGEIVGTVEQGPYLKIPLLDTVFLIDVRTRTIKNEYYANEDGKVLSNNPLESASKDLQDVKISSVVNYKINSEKVRELYEQYRTEENFEEQILKPIIKKVIKETTSLYTAEELVTKRAEYNSNIDGKLTTAFSDIGVIFEQSNITNLSFSDSFNKAIEAKVTAEQEALKAQNDLKRIEFEADQRIATAEAEAEAIRISAQAINSQGGADYVKLKAIEKWNGSLPTQMIPNSTVPFIDLK